MAKPVFGLESLNKGLSQCTKADALRIKRNFVWYIKSSVSNPSVKLDDFFQNRKAPIYHHFNCHEWCSPTWCWEKQIDKEEDEEECQIARSGEHEANFKNDGNNNDSFSYDPLYTCILDLDCTEDSVTDDDYSDDITSGDKYLDFEKDELNSLAIGHHISLVT